MTSGEGVVKYDNRVPDDARRAREISRRRGEDRSTAHFDELIRSIEGEQGKEP